MGDEHGEECEARRHKDNVGYLAGLALQGLLASPQPGIQKLGFNRLVNLAAEYGEALAKRLDTPSQT
jgi:hypothetical protein